MTKRRAFTPLRVLYPHWYTYVDYAEPLERSEEAYGAHLFWTGQSTALREHRGALLAREYACAVEDNDFTP